MRALLVTTLLLTCGISEAAEHRVDAFLEPAAEVYLGQQVRLIVEVETDTWFTTAPRYPELRIPGAIVLQPDAFGVNSTRREGGTTWTGQRQRYVIFPQRPGTLVIPSFEISFTASTVGETSAGRAAATTTLSTPEVTASVQAPPGAEDAGTYLTVRKFTLRESWEGSLTGARVGDALVRTITQSAAETFALVLPALTFPETPGLAIYPAQPRLEDRTNRGQYSATRTDAVTYVLQEAGTFVIPSLEVQWFDLDSMTMRQALLDAIELEVADNPAAELGEGALPDATARLESGIAATLNWLQHNLIWLTLIAAALWFGTELWLRFRKPLADWWQRLAYARRYGEAAYFRRALRAAERGTADEFVADFWAWSDRLPDRAPPLTAGSLLTQADQNEASDQLERFVEARYGEGDATTQRVPVTAAATLKRVRRSWFSQARTASNPGALNP